MWEYNQIYAMYLLYLSKTFFTNYMMLSNEPGIHYIYKTVKEYFAPTILKFYIRNFLPRVIGKLVYCKMQDQNQTA